MHLTWTILFGLSLVAALVFGALLFAASVSEKFLPKKKLFGVLLVVCALLAIVSGYRYQVTLPEEKRPPVTQSTTQNLWQRHTAVPTTKGTSVQSRS